jgi:hypothetical protein
MTRTIASTLAILVVLAGSASAGESNQTINVQGVLRDITGSLQSMAVGLVVKIYSTKDAEQPFYTQTYTTVPVDNGFFSVELAGDGLGFSGRGDAWVGIQVAGDPTELPRQHIGAAPYSFSAVAADGLSAACSGCVDNGKLANASVTVTAGEGLVGGGAVQLGGNVTVSLAKVPNLLGTKTLTGTQTVSGQTNWTNFCPAQNINIPAPGTYKVDGTWAGSSGTCPHASCVPVIGGKMIDTGTDVWPGIINWNGNWYSSSVHGQVADLAAGPTTLQWQCHFNAACTGTMECYRFAASLMGPF